MTCPNFNSASETFDNESSGWEQEHRIERLMAELTTFLLLQESIQGQLCEISTLSPQQQAELSDNSLGRTMIQMWRDILQTCRRRQHLA